MEALELQDRPADTKRRTYLIKPALQLKYLATSVAMAVGIALVAYFALTYALYSSSRLAALSDQDIAILQSSFRSVLVWVVLFITIVFGIESLIRFHRIAGPLYAIERVLTAFAAGDFSQELRVRRKDELKDLVTDLQVMREGMRRFILQDRELCREIELRLDRAANLARQGAAAEAISSEIDAVRKELSLIAAQYKV